MAYRSSIEQESIVVAASNAPDALKRLADPYVCDGTADQDTINTAITAALLTQAVGPLYGAVSLTAGRFSLTGAVLLPSRGFQLRGQGFGTQLYAAVGSGGWSTVGAGSTLACIMLNDSAAASAASLSSVSLSVCDLSINAGDVTGISGIWLDHTNGGNGGATSDSTLGDPIGGTAEDTYHSFSRLRIRGVDTGLAFVGGSNTNTRGNNVYDVVVSDVADNGFYLSQASDCHFNSCQAIGSTAVGATGFNCDGGNTRLTKCLAKDFTHSSGIGFLVASSRISLGFCKSDSCMTGIDANSSDTRITGFTATTSVAGMNTAVDLRGASRTNATGISIFTSGSGTYTNGLYVPNNGGNCRVDAYIRTTGITNRFIETTGGVITTVSAVPNGMFNVEYSDGTTFVTTS